MYITLKGICKSYIDKASGAKIEATRGVSLDIMDAKVTGIIGKSGAGKSTLVRMVSLLERPDKGQVLYDSRRVDCLKGMALLKERRTIGMIFQNFNLFYSRNAIANVAYPLEITGDYSKSNIYSRSMELLELVGLKDKAISPISVLSGGQKQRVAIARALASKPRVLFCDEATSALDPETTHSILELLRKIQRELNLTIVMITHQLEVVRDACDYVAVLEQGAIVEEGSTTELFTNPKSAVAQELLRHLPLGSSSKPSLIRWSPKGGKYILRFVGEATDRPIISCLVRDIGVEVNIRAGGVQCTVESKVGTMIVDILGDEGKVRRSIDYLRSLGVIVEDVKEQAI